jgi:hypothetical protein
LDQKEAEKLHNGELHVLYSSPDTMIMLMRMGWAGHVGYRHLVGKTKRRNT